MSRFQPRQLAPIEGHRPPGEHVTFPEIAWPEPLQEAPAIHEPQARTRRTRPREVPLVVEMIEPEHGRLTPWVFWALVLLSFACVLAKSAGWL